MELKEKIDQLKKENRLILECEGGSHLYNLNRPTSDYDIRGIFIPTMEDLLNLNNIDKELSDDKSDIKYYSLDKFLKLAADCNPNIIELLFVPEKSILYKNEIYDELIKNRHLFMSKKANYTFGGYAYTQIKRCKGQGKKANSIDNYMNELGINYWMNEYIEDKEKVQRIMGRFFCQYLNKIGINHKDNYDINEANKMLPPNMNDYIDLYSVTEDGMPFRPVKFNYNINEYDIARVEGQTNLYRLYKNGHGFMNNGTINLESISMDREKTDFAGIISINSALYESTKRNYDSFWEWMANRNEERYNTAWDKEKKTDCKNLMHCYRLLLSAKNIAEYGEPKIRFEGDERDFLLNIREGNVDVDKIIEDCDKMIEELNIIFENSSLRHSSDIKNIQKLYNKIILEHSK